MNRPKLLLADDHTMFSQGLQSLLEDEFELVGAVADGQALVEYSLLLALIAVVAFGAVNEFGLGVSTLYSQIVSGVKAGMP